MQEVFAQKLCIQIKALLGESSVNIGCISVDDYSEVLDTICQAAFGSLEKEKAQEMIENLKSPILEGQRPINPLLFYNFFKFFF